MELTELEQRRVVVVYCTALLPLGLLIVQWLRDDWRPGWRLRMCSGFVLCAVGWELWFTYGLVDGQNVDARRPPALNAAIPQHLNWLLNSLADAGAIGLVGLLLVGCVFETEDAFGRWHWGAFAILFVWFMAQNIWVELFLYHGQLGTEHRLSWAPLAPSGPWINPTLFEVSGRPVQLQTQLPWLLATPVFYAISIACFGRFGRQRLGADVRQ